MEVLAYLWVFAALSLWLWHFIRFWRLGPHLKKVDSHLPDGSDPISLIICFKNEESNLETLIPFWCEQNYAEYEVLLVDDHSSDQGVELVEKFQKNYPHLVLVKSGPENDSGKKAALARGITKARYENLVFCDADCKPASSNWLKRIAAKLENHDLVLGYGALKGQGFTGSLSEYETVSTLIRYWSYALSGRTFMGVGRNLAYRRSVMKTSQALERHADLLSGDDDLTLREQAANLRTAILSHPEAYTYSPSPKKLLSWWNQKGRHYSTAWRYANSIKILLGFEGFLQLLFVLLLPFAILYLSWWLWASLVILRLFTGFYPISGGADLVSGAGIKFLWLPLEMFWALATTLLHIRNLVFGPPKKW